MAELEELPLNFITKIAAKLNQAGIINSFHGISGGNNLARPLNQISVYDVFVALHGENYIKECFEGSEENFKGIEAIEKFFNLLQLQLTEKLKNTTFQYILENGMGDYLKKLEIGESVSEYEIKKYHRREQELKELEEKVKKENTLDIAKNLLEVLNEDMVAKKTGLTLEEVRNLK